MKARLCRAATALALLALSACDNSGSGTTPRPGNSGDAKADGPLRPYNADEAGSAESPASEPKGDVKGSLDDELKRASQALNEQLPMMIDSETRLDATMGFANQFRYNITLVRHPAAEVDAWKLEQNMHPIIINRVCTSREMQGFLRNGVELSWSIYGNDGRQITVISVPPSACRS